MSDMLLMSFEEQTPLAGYVIEAGTATFEISDTKDSPTCFKCDGGNDEIKMADTWFSNETQYSLCFHFKILTMPGSGETFGFIAGAESPTYDEQRYSYLDENGDIYLTSGIMTSMVSLSADTWYVYICRWVDNTIHYHEIRDLAGNVMGYGSGGATAINDFCWIAHDSTTPKGGNQSANGGVVLIDNVVVDTTQSVNLIDSVIGSEDYVIHPLYITGAGDAMEWGTGSYADIDELPADDGTTELTQDGGSGDIDALCALENLNEMALRPIKEIIGITNWCRRNSRNLGSGGMTVGTLIKSGSTEAAGNSSNAEAWNWVFGNWDQDPDTVAAWILAGINALQCGARAIGGSARGGDCSASFVNVLYTPAILGNQIIWMD